MRDSIRQSNETALIQVEGKAENVLNAVRQNFLQMASRSLTEEMVEAEDGEVPYPKSSRSFIDDFAGDETYINYVGGYAFVNYKKRWVLSNKG